MAGENNENPDEIQGARESSLRWRKNKPFRDLVEEKVNQESPSEFESRQSQLRVNEKVNRGEGKKETAWKNRVERKVRKSLRKTAGRK